MARVFMVCLLLFTQMATAQVVEVKNARLWAAPDHTRVVLDISAPVEHTLFTLDNPSRIVIDLDNARTSTRLGGNKGLVKRIRTGKRDGNNLRIVLDLSKSVKPKSYVLKPNQQYGHRLVLDLYESATAQQAKAVAPSNRSRDVVIAIDAGHGGDDPGARGSRGTLEKDVVLAIARRLQRMIDREPGMKAIMIRDGDYYVGLRKRMKIARDNRADLFISIHADAFHDKRAHGSSVYALSQRGASTEAARFLAESENASDFIGGVSLEDKDDLLTEVLLDLSMNGTIEASLEFGGYVLDELKGVGKVHKHRVEQAGFVVLKSPDVPSILVETAFISNPHEERKLRDPRHQEKMARSIFNGVKRYFQKNRVPGTHLAQQSKTTVRKHVIARGDTLSQLAQRYQVSMTNIKKVNGLKSDRLRVGDVLRIPH